MSNQEFYRKMVLCMNAIKMAKESDYRYQHNPRVTRDGTDDWSRAAEYFTELTGQPADWNTMCTLASTCVIAQM